MDEYDDTAQYADDYDAYQEEEEANGHDLDEEDVENQKMEDALYKSDEDEEPPSEDEFEEDGILGLEKEQEDNVDDLTTPSAKVAKKEPTGVPSKIVPSSKRRTRPIMTKFEYSYLISQRAVMIEHDSPLMIPETDFVNAIDIAKEETERKVNPIIIVRHLPNGTIEEWKCSELELPKKFI
jgi:DNA-directed RNA polymerase subunit K/omega